MINISEMAGDKIQEMLAAEEAPNLFLRIGVQEGGCSGFSYGMGFDDELHDTDKEMEIGGVKVVVDADSMKYLNGLVIDWKDSAMGGGFTINTLTLPRLAAAVRALERQQKRATQPRSLANSGMTGFGVLWCSIPG